LQNHGHGVAVLDEGGTGARRKGLVKILELFKVLDGCAIGSLAGAEHDAGQYKRLRGCGQFGAQIAARESDNISAQTQSKSPLCVF